jgi:hypothetical protein
LEVSPDVQIELIGRLFGINDAPAKFSPREAGAQANTGEARDMRLKSMASRPDALLLVAGSTRKANQFLYFDADSFHTSSPLSSLVAVLYIQSLNLSYQLSITN